MRKFTVLALLAALSSGIAAQDPVSLDTLHVQVGSRTSSILPAAVRSVEVIDRTRIESTPARTIAELLHWAIGVDIQARSPAQADVSVRGGSFEEVLVLVDGVRMSDVQTGHFDLDLAVPLEEIERIEILRGPASAQYGSDAVGGVINVVTRKQGNAIEARLEGGSFETVSGWLGGTPGGALSALRWGLEHGRSDGSREGTDYRITQARLGLDTELGRGALHADVAYAARDFGAADFYAPFGSYEETRTFTTSAAWTGRLGAVTLEPRVRARRHDDDFILIREDPGFYRNRHTTWQLGGDIAGRMTPRPDITVVAGLEFARDAIDSNALGDRAETRQAAFAELQWGRMGEALIQAGARVDGHEKYGTFGAPSLAVAVWPVQTLRLRGSVGSSFRAPGWTERYYQDPANIGTPTLEPERAWTAEFGFEIAPSADVKADVVAFYRDAEELIDWARPLGADETEPWRTMNIENATFRGIEASLGMYALRGQWTASATFLSIRAGESSGYFSKYVLQPVTQTASIGASLEPVARWTLGFRARHARRHGGDAHFLADARVAWSAGATRVYLDATNLFDEDYLDVSVKPGAGRALRVGLTWSPEI